MFDTLSRPNPRDAALALDAWLAHRVTTRGDAAARYAAGGSA